MLPARRWWLGRFVVAVIVLGDDVDVLGLDDERRDRALELAVAALGEGADGSHDVILSLPSGDFDGDR